MKRRRPYYLTLFFFLLICAVTWSSSFLFTLSTRSPWDALPIDTTVIYQDTFTLNAGDLAGRPVETGLETNTLWIGSTDGFSVQFEGAVIATGPKTALLPFTPEPNRIYTLSADITVFGADGWAALGFVATDDSVTGSQYFFSLQDYPAPWLNLKPDGTLPTFAGPGTGERIAFDGNSSDATLQIILNTYSNEWVATYTLNGTALRTNVYSGALTNINYVGFGSSDDSCTITVDNFRLTEKRSAYYVSSSGDNTWDGRSSTWDGGSSGPWQTLQRADNTVFQPGDILFLNRGDVFQGPITLQGSGDSDNPCTVMPYGDGPLPVIESPSSYGMSFLDDAWTVQDLEFRDCLTGIALQWRDKTDWEYFRFNKLYMHDITQNSAIHWMTTGNTNPEQTIFRNIQVNDSLFEYNKKAWGTYVTTNDAGFSTFNDLSFDNCTFISNGYGVVSLQFVTTGEVSNCFFKDNGSPDHTSASLMLQTADRCTVRDTIIRGTRRYGTLHDGQGLNFEGHCRNCLVDNVEIYDCDGAAVMFFNKSGKSHENLEVRNCTFYNNCLNPHPDQGRNDLIFYGSSTGEIHHNNWYHREEVNFIGAIGDTNGFSFHDNSETVINDNTDSTVIYEDSFLDSPGPLEGRTVESGGSAGETWLTKEGFETDGFSASISSNLSRVAALPFTPATGERYRLSADISVAEDSWAAIGFIANSSVVNGREFFFNLIDDSSPWINITATGIINTFGGPLTGDKVAFPNLGTNGTLTIELDTSRANWTAMYSFNGTALRTNTFSGTLTNINYVGFGNYSPANMTVDNFKLEIINEPAEVSLTHNTYVPIYDFAQPSSDVDFFHRNLSEFDLHAHRLREDSDSALQSIVNLQDTHGYRISCTTGSFSYDPDNPQQSGEICAQVVLDSVERFYSFGGEISRIYIDHPWQIRWQQNPTNDRLVVSTGMTMQQTAEELTDLVEIIHTNYPNWEIFLLPNFVNYGWKGDRAYRSSSGELLGVGDFYDELTTIYSNLTSNGLPLNGVLIDFPYPSAAGITVPLDDVYNGPPDEFDWFARIRDLENETEALGLQFGIINNSNGGAVGQGYTFYEDSLSYLETYTGAPYYGTPALWAPRTWYTDKPPEQVPEICRINSDGGNYTMSGIVNATTDRVKHSDIDGSLQAFNQTGFEEGWIAQAETISYSVTNGHYRGMLETTNGSIRKTTMDINGSQNPVIEIAFAADAGTTAQISYQIDNSTEEYGPVHFTINPDSEVHVYEIDMSSDSVWMNADVIRSLTISPSDHASAVFAIDTIWVRPDF